MGVDICESELTWYVLEYVRVRFEYFRLVGTL
jgi:hypothetical protein